jgi:hypothetical protein
MHWAHSADTRPAAIFIHNGAPQALVGSQGLPEMTRGQRAGGRRPPERPELISAIAGINAQGRGHIHEIARRIADLPFANSASVVTGRFDIIVDIVVAGDVADLYQVELIPGVGAPGEIVRSETFVVMTSLQQVGEPPQGLLV